MGYSVWLQDLNDVVAALSRKVPHVSCFTAIRGNYLGDFIIEVGGDVKYMVKHEDWSVWEMVRKESYGFMHYYWREVK